MPAQNYFRQILALDDAELEVVMRDWVALKSKAYHEIQRFSGSQDLGRDVVGFLSAQRHEGSWHNYQCKQFNRRRVPLNSGLVELAKIFVYADAKHFVLPTAYFFVAPHGLSRKLELLLDKPTEFREYFLGNWDAVCATRISNKRDYLLTDAVRNAIANFDFGSVRRITLEEMLAAEGVDLVLHRHFGADPGPAWSAPHHDTSF